MTNRFGIGLIYFRSMLSPSPRPSQPAYLPCGKLILLTCNINATGRLHRNNTNLTRILHKINNGQQSCKRI